MPSLWTDNDTGGHPWLAASPHAGAAVPPPPTPAPGRGEHDDSPPAWQRFARPALIGAACIAAVLAGAAIGLLR